MNWFNIKDIENLCGIKAHTLRIWEQRYNLRFATRNEGKHRFYDNEALKKLLRISFLYHNGLKISRIASMTSAQIDQMVDKYGAASEQSSNESSIRKLIEAGLDFNREKFIEIINAVLKKMEMDKCITEVFYPFLQRIGLLWMTDHVIPAQEHFVSNIIQERIILAIDGLTEIENKNNNVLIFAPPGEFHEIPLLTASYFFKKYGHQPIYFGCNTMLESIDIYLHKQENVTILFSHVITLIDNIQLATYFEEIKKKWPGKKIIVSGPATKCLMENNAAFRIVHSLNEMILLMKIPAEITSA